MNNADMVANKKDILSQALTLPEVERREIVAALNESLDTSELGQKRLAELRDRYDAYLRGDISTVDGPDAVRELRQL